MCNIAISGHVTQLVRQNEEETHTDITTATTAAKINTQLAKINVHNFIASLNSYLENPYVHSIEKREHF